MNIFRDLVEELKEEKLLEDTVIESGSESSDSIDDSPDLLDAELPPVDEISEDHPVEQNGSIDESAADAESDPEQSAEPEVIDTLEVDLGLSFKGEIDFSNELDSESESDVEEPEIAEAGDQPVSNSPSEQDTDSPEPSVQSPAPQTRPRSTEEERYFYRQRAMDEVTGLQLVEHVFSGVEREQMKSTPKTFDDLAVKRSLHDFLKVADNINSPEHAQAEFQLMQETENWASALSRRDRNISVAHLRRYCETTQPSLSSQAMISLARFYRNSPFSESVRSKFDLVFTKLFSKDIEKEKRAVVFEHEELITHIQELYADWSSIPLYSTDDEDSELILMALKFQDFINEAEIASLFDELVRNDFFKRLKMFKESTHENFFAPIIVATAIESNVAVGNRYVDLIEKERQNSEFEELSVKYVSEHLDSISDATSKTQGLLEILNDVKPEPETVPVPPVRKEKPKKSKVPLIPDTDVDQPKAEQIKGVNKWLVVAAVVLAIVTGWFYLGPASSVGGTMMRGNGTAVDFKLRGTFLNDHVHSARISKNTLYGITRDSWSDLSNDKKRELIKKSVVLGEGNGFRKVHLLDASGQSLAFGSKTRVKIY